MRYQYDNKKEILRIDLDEEIDIKSCRVLKNIIDGYIIKYEPKEFIINLTEVKFMDSSGIGLLIGRYNLIKLFNCKMILVNATNNIKRVLELSQVTKDIEMRSA